MLGLGAKMAKMANSRNFSVAKIKCYTVCHPQKVVTDAAHTNDSGYVSDSAGFEDSGLNPTHPHQITFITGSANYGQVSKTE